VSGAIPAKEPWMTGGDALDPAGDAAGPVEAVTPADGCFAVNGLAAGRCTLIVTHPQRLPCAPVSIDLQRGEKRDGIEVRSAAGASLVIGWMGTLPDPRWQVRLVQALPGNSYSSIWEQSLAGAQRIERTVSHFRGMQRGEYLLELL